MEKGTATMVDELSRMSEQLDQVDKRTRTQELAMTTMSEKISALADKIAALTTTVSEFVRHQIDCDTRMGDRVEAHATALAETALRIEQLAAGQQNHGLVCPQREKLERLANDSRWMRYIGWAVITALVALAFEVIKQSLTLTNK